MSLNTGRARRLGDFGRLRLDGTWVRWSPQSLSTSCRTRACSSSLSTLRLLECPVTTLVMGPSPGISGLLGYCRSHPSPQQSTRRRLSPLVPDLHQHLRPCGARGVASPKKVPFAATQEVPAVTVNNETCRARTRSTRFRVGVKVKGRDNAGSSCSPNPHHLTVLTSRLCLGLLPPFPSITWIRLSAP
jgi:hypothetical protein